VNAPFPKRPKLPADREAIRTFCAALFEHATPGSVVSLRAFGRLPGGGKDEPYYTIAGRPRYAGRKFSGHPVVRVTEDPAWIDELVEVTARIVEDTANDEITAVACPINATFKPDEKCEKDSIVDGLEIILDCDANPISARARAIEIMGQPTFEIVSGGEWFNPQTGEFEPKRHLHWLLDEPARGERDVARLWAIVHRLARAVPGGDRSMTVVHPARICGSWNTKNLSNPKACEIVGGQHMRRVSLDEAEQALDAVKASAARSVKNGRGPTLDVPEDTSDDAHVAQITTGASYHEPLRNLAVRFARRRFDQGTAVNILRGLMRAVPEDKRDGAEPGRWQARYDAIPALVRSGSVQAQEEKDREAQTVYEWKDTAPANDRAVDEIDDGEPPQPPVDRARREIVLADGQLSEIVDQVNAALAATTELEIYRTPEGLVRVHMSDREIQRWRMDDGGTTNAATVREHMTQPLDGSQIRYLAGRCIAFKAWDKRVKGLLAKDCPADVADTVRSLGGRQTPAFRDLDAIVNGPQLRPDGTVMATPGYDRHMRTLFVGKASAFPQVKDAPTKADAEKALATLLDLLDEFPFVRDDEDVAEFPKEGDRQCAARSVALAAMLTAVSRHAFPHVPAFGISARAPGTGKSYLADLISALASGRLASVYAFADKPEEFDKRLDAALLAHEALIAIDNVAGGAALGHSKLEQIITQPEVTVRRLGGSNQFKVRPRAIVLATGNNLIARGDMTRRILMCTLDAEHERPEQRTFTKDPVTAALVNRGEYVHAALTIVRAYIAAGRTDQKLPPLAGFDNWSRTVRAALVWLGEADPVRTMEVARASDPIREQLVAVVDAWNSTPTLAGCATSAGELIKAAKAKANPPTGPNAEVPNTALLDALAAVATKGVDLNPNRLGVWLQGFKGRRVTIGEGADARVAWFEEHGTAHKVKTYKLRTEAKMKPAPKHDGDEAGDFLV
jgi:putative DNA primase/helicase